MKRALPILSVILLSSAFLFLYLFNLVINSLANCTYYNNDLDQVYLFGEVAKKSEEDNWFVSEIELCSSKVLSISKVRVLTPKNIPHIAVGDLIDVEGNEGYRWLNLQTDRIDPILGNGKSVFIRVKELKSEDQIVGEYIESLDEKSFDCVSDQGCLSKKIFLEKFGSSQMEFLWNIKNGKIFPLFLNFLKGDSIIYSTQFGNIESGEKFRDLVQAKML